MSNQQQLYAEWIERFRNEHPNEELHPMRRRIAEVQSKLGNRPPTGGKRHTASTTLPEAIRRMGEAAQRQAGKMQAQAPVVDKDAAFCQRMEETAKKYAKITGRF